MFDILKKANERKAPLTSMGFREWARVIKRDVHALYLASRDPRFPWYAKALAIIVTGYALSPIDLIPDFIPVIGYLDDVVLVPVGIWLVVRMIPPDLMTEHREIAAALQDRPVSPGAAAAIVLVWVAAAAFAGALALQSTEITSIAAAK